MTREVSVQPRIFLLGYMCSGKTTLGRALSEALHVPFTDLDLYIEQEQNRTVTQIFASEGEDGFRRIESACLDRLIALSADRPFIIALGGGTPCRPGCMKKLNACGKTVFLEVSEPRLVERLELGAANRPLVAGKTTEQIAQTVSDMLRRRLPFYTQAACRFDASRLETPEQIADSVDRFINQIILSQDS